MKTVQKQREHIQNKGNRTKKRKCTFKEKGDALFAAYLKLCDDEKWGVRKGCVESIVGISRVEF